MMKPVLVTTGEPAGIGPDVCIKVARHHGDLVFVGDKQMLAERAMLLNISLELIDYEPGRLSRPGQMMVYNISCPVTVIPGQPDVKNSKAIMDMLEWSGLAVLQGQFSALVTAPVNKAILQYVKKDFIGHTEYFQHLCQSPQVVMMLSDEHMRVALVTTHVPLREVADRITPETIKTVVKTIHRGLQKDFGIYQPKIAIAGLNPHAGENGVLGQEEIQIIEPTVKLLRQQGIDIEGPFSADTLFTKKNYDVFIAMYHDQGLNVLKYASFGQAANISLGLPMIRTSVDHGTAFEIAGTGKAKCESMVTAIKIARLMAFHRGSS